MTGATDILSTIVLGIIFLFGGITLITILAGIISVIVRHIKEKIKQKI